MFWGLAFINSCEWESAAHEKDTVFKFIETKQKKVVECNSIRSKKFLVYCWKKFSFYVLFRQISAVYVAQWNIIFIINSSKQILFHAFNKFYQHFMKKKWSMSYSMSFHSFIHSHILMDQNSMQKLKFHSVIFYCAVYLSFDISNSKMLCATWYNNKQ